MKKVFAVVAVMLVMAGGFASAGVETKGGSTTNGGRAMWAG